MRVTSLIPLALGILIHSTLAYPGFSLIGLYCNTVGEIIDDTECEPGSSPASAPEPTPKLRIDPKIPESATEIYGNHEGSNASYPDGSGNYVRTDDFRQWDNGDECFTELYYVETKNHFTDWDHRGSNDCGVNSTNCVLGVGDVVQTYDNLDIAVEASAELDIIKDIISASAGGTYTDGRSKCEELRSEARCEWKDEQCHAIYSRFQQRKNYGYIRRRCNFQGAGNETVWSLDVVNEEKGRDLDLGCKASCNATTYPGS